MPRLLLIDNYDSFTYNLVTALKRADIALTVVLNDQATVAELAAMSPDALVISPGPGTPDDAGISIAAIQHFAGQIPILGVCMGLQCIAAAFGASIVRAIKPMHGKVSPVTHDGLGVFAPMPPGFAAGRYHSLVVDPATLPPDLLATAWTLEHELMGLRHARLPIEGVQFHPESVLTPEGPLLLQQFLRNAFGPTH